MSTPINIQAAITCGGRHEAPVRLIVPLGARKRGQYDDYATGYANGRGWTAYRPTSLEDLTRMVQPLNMGATFNDWRCPDCTKAGVA